MYETIPIVDMRKGDIHNQNTVAIIKIGIKGITKSSHLSESEGFITF